MTVLDKFRLDGKVAIIPGGGGRHRLRPGLRAGRAPAPTSPSWSAPRSWASRRRRRSASAGCRSLTVAGDMTKEEDADRAVAETIAALGRLDIIINAIGGGAGKVLFPAHEYPRDAWDWIFELNVRANLLPTQAAVRAHDRRRPRRPGAEHLLGAGGPRHQRRLLGLRGGQGSHQLPDPSDGHRVGPYDITVNAIAPTFVDTPQVAMLLEDPDFKKGVVSRIPLGRVGTPEDLIGAVLFFCSDASSFVTGQILHIDGGLTATQ